VRAVPEKSQRHQRAFHRGGTRHEPAFNPHRALREALVNAVAHRNYEDASRKIAVQIFSDRIVVASPGYPPSRLTLAKLRCGNYRPCSRNSVIAQAIDYALKRWEALTRFVEDGSLEIDNNICENSSRASAVGKRNWLFVGHPEAGERSAVIYTLLGSCRRPGVNPFEYLKDLFTRLPSVKITQIKEFTPAAWAKAKAREKVVALAA